MDDLDDRELLARLAGDERAAQAAFDALFRRWYARLVRAADAVVRDQAVAEELVQDVMLELWRRRERLGADGAAHAYLFQAVRNRALNHVRHLKVRQRGALRLVRDEAAAAPAPGELEAGELDAAIRAALDTLPPRCRAVFDLSRSGGLRYAEIAERLGVSVKAVEAQMGRALRTLRERLAEWLPEGNRL
jgi:RNA polymerase sigma-70 factor (ECF subfamily)